MVQMRRSNAMIRDPVSYLAQMIARQTLPPRRLCFLPCCTRSSKAGQRIKTDKWTETDTASSPPVQVGGWMPVSVILPLPSPAAPQATR